MFKDTLGLTHLFFSWFCSWVFFFCCGCCDCWTLLTLRYCSCCHPQNHYPRQDHRPRSGCQERNKKNKNKHHFLRGEVKVSHTDERFRLLLNPPSFILRGATFLVLALFLFSCGLDTGFDFLRALGPANTK